MIFWQRKPFRPVVKYIAIKTVDKMAKIASAIMSATSNFENDSRHDVFWLSDIILRLSEQTRVVVDWFTNSMACWSPITSILTSSPFPLRSRSFWCSSSSLEWMCLCQLYIILKNKTSITHIYILTCKVAVWSRFVCWASNIAFIAFIAFIFHDILTAKSVSASREIHCHKNRWQNGEDSDWNHECYFQFWKW